ncbi:MAG: family 20 glycosylhydrolase [Bacteroidota bacterium]
MDGETEPSLVVIPARGNDNLKYGGYYTQDQIKEVVAYAQKRYITIVPEIELPGHASAAIAAYPELSCFPNESTQHPEECAWSGDTTGKQVQQTWGVFDDVFCAGKENTFKVLEDVMDEVMTLFPSKMIHVGGDESPKVNWKRCPNCQKRMKDNGLKDEHELQSYFIQRMEKYLNSKGRTLIGWDEILEGGLAPKALVMSWRGEEGGIAAAKQNHDVVMTPGGWVYFDHSQSQNEDSVTIGGYIPIEKVYTYEPVPAGLDAEQAKHILGAQANLWSEYTKNTRKVEYMIFPRISALSEVLWSPKEKRNWEGFEKRLQTQFKRYDLWRVNYSKAYFDLKATILPTENHSGVLWKIQSKYSRNICEYCHIQILEEFTYKNDTEIYDTIAKFDPKDISKIIGYDIKKTMRKAGEKGFRYGNSPWMDDTVVMIKIDESKNVKARQRFHHTKGQEIEQMFHFNKATGKQISLSYPPSENYPGDGALTLVNGVQNEKGLSKSKEFVGFNGTNCDALIDMDGSRDISSVTIHAFQQKGSWIWPPISLEILSSDNGQYFNSLGTTKNFVETQNGNGTMSVNFKTSSAKYVRVVIKNYGPIAEGNPGAGNKAWLFVDEIEIN